MANITYRQNKRGELSAKIQVSGKDPNTGERRFYLKNIKNEANLTESKFKKYVSKEAVLFEENIINQYKDDVQTIRTGVLPFHKLADEWVSTIEATLSHNYYLRAKVTTTLFNEYLKSIGMYNAPISDIRVRDVQMFLNSFSKGYVKGAKKVKLKKPLPSNISFRALERANVCNRFASYHMNNTNASISEDTARAICNFAGIKMSTYFEDASERVKYSPETIKGHRRTLRTLFNEAVRYEWITKNPVCSTKIGSGSGNITLRAVDEKEVFTIKETQEFLTALDNEKDSYFYRVIPVKIMVLCGLRLGEICGLRWSDIDFENKVLKVNRSRQSSTEKGVYEKEPKTKTSKRIVPMPQSLLKDLKEYWKWFDIAVPRFEQNLDKYYIAVNVYREPIYPDSLGGWLTKFEKRNGFKHVSCHGLRHTYCSILLAKGVPLQTVSKFMGHSDSAVTLQVYSHFMPDTQNQVLDALDSITENGAGE